MSLAPDDHIAVMYSKEPGTAEAGKEEPRTSSSSSDSGSSGSLTQQQIRDAGTYTDHVSMADLRTKEPLTLDDCISAFSKR